MSLTNPNKIVTEERLSGFYQQILPYLGGMPEMVANKFSKGDLYSTDEKMIGVWVDNRPLYKKTYIVEVSQNSSNIIVDANIKRPDVSLVDARAVKLVGTSSDSWDQLIPFEASNKPTQSIGITPNGVILSPTSLSVGNIVRLTIQYTKTTDSPISIGSDTDYSTDEKIVGTWIDGSYVWQKTFTGSALISSTSWTTAFNIPKAGIAQIVGAFGTGSPSSGGQYWDLLAALDAHNTYIGFLAARDNATCDVRTITLQYTKTS